MSDMTAEVIGQVFVVVVGSKPLFTVVTSLPTSAELVMSAWSYAVRYSARGLDLPDYEAAEKLMKQRHPKWTYIPGGTLVIGYRAALAENDTPDDQ